MLVSSPVLLPFFIALVRYLKEFYHMLYVSPKSLTYYIVAIYLFSSTVPWIG